MARSTQNTDADASIALHLERAQKCRPFPIGSEAVGGGPSRVRCVPVRACVTRVCARVQAHVCVRALARVRWRVGVRSCALACVAWVRWRVRVTRCALFHTPKFVAM